MATAVADDAGEAHAARAHELRDSVAALRLIVEALRDGVVDPAQDPGILDQMMLHVRHLSDLLDDQLHAGETRCAAVITRPVRFKAFLEQWSDAMRPKAEQHGVYLSLDVASALPDVECRVAQVARVLIILIDNAVRHTPAGGSVVVRARAHPGGVQIQVNDTGPGLRPAAQADPFEHRHSAIPSTRPGRRGLVIARTIVESHGGALWAGSSARGASVRFYLPATASAGA